MADPGWYPDGAGNLRWFDGNVWTEHVQPKTTRRPAIFGPLLILVSFAALFFFVLSHPSISVPLAGTQDCGSNSFSLAVSSEADVQAAASDSFTRALIRECIREGRSNVYKGIGAAVVGLIAGGMVTSYERRR